MASGFNALAQAGIQNAEAQAAQNRELEDEKRKGLLKTLLEDAATPQDKVAVYDAVYHKDPGVLKQHVENLTRRLTGRQPQPVASPQQAEASRIAALAPRLQTPAQQNVGAYQEYIKAGFAPEQAAQMIGVRQPAAKLVNLLSPDKKTTQTVDVNDPTARGLIQQGWTLQPTGSSRPVPGYSEALNLSDAQSLAQSQGQTYLGKDGQAWDLAALPPGAVLVPMFTNQGNYWTVATDKGRYETAGNQRLLEPAVGGPNPNAPSIGPARVPTARSSTTTDPFGVMSTTSSVSSPQTLPAPRAGTAPSVAAPAAATPHSQSGTPNLRPRTKTEKAPPVAPGAQKLDSNGHIPESDLKKYGINPYLAQAADSLLDGMDVDKLAIPQKDRTAAQHLAEQYGYKGQGLFTPREVLQLKEGASVIQQMISSPSLSVLDQGAIANLPMLGQSADPSKAGLWGRLTTSLASKAASPQQQDFLRYWRQLDALAIGLRGLVQTGRATQAQVERLIAELPNPYNTASSEDARNRLRMVQSELKVAADTGKLPDVPLGQPGGAGHAEVWVRDKNGKLVKQ